jgi:putative ATP-dependent endonuclease of the OLD family
VDFGKSNVGFVTMGGVRNFAYFAAESTLSFLVKRQVAMWFILDRDEKEQAEIDIIRKRMGAESHLVILSKRELENYLIQPEAIKEFILLKRRLAGTTDVAGLPDLDELTEQIDREAESLRRLAVDKRLSKIACVPVLYDQRRIFQGDVPVVDGIDSEIEKLIKQLTEAKANLKKVQESISSEFSKHWGENKLSVVPGDILLDSLCKVYGVRYKKDLGDGARLASFLSGNNIDKELRDVIEAIVA